MSANPYAQLLTELERHLRMMADLVAQARGEEEPLPWERMGDQPWMDPAGRGTAADLPSRPPDPPDRTPPPARARSSAPGPEDRRLGQPTTCEGRGDKPGCGKPIMWLKTRKGKWIPVDPREDGTFPRGDEYFDSKTMTAHFATCPYATQHSQGSAGS